MATLTIGASTLNSRSIRRVERQILQRGLDCIGTASARALSRVAAKARSDQIRHIEDTIDDPVPFTRNSPRFDGVPRGTPLAQQQSRVFIPSLQSRYLRPLLAGQQTTQHANQKPIVYEPTPAVIRGEVRGRGGLRLNRSGNIARLGQGRLRDLLDNDDVFEVPFGSTAEATRHLNDSPGIYLRRFFGRGRARFPIVIKLINYREASPRDSDFDFTEQGVATFRQNIGPFYFDELRKCLRQETLRASRA